MKFFQSAYDGGKDSGVTGFFLVEIKPLFSIVLLRFKEGSREAYHSHAFNALTWFLSGDAAEIRFHSSDESEKLVIQKYKRSLLPKFTSRSNMHRVYAFKKSWMLSIRGPWAKTWQELKDGKLITLTHGRRVIES